MGLEDKSDLATKLFHRFGAGTVEGLAEDLEMALLDTSKCPEEGQEGGFAGSARAGHDDNFARVNRQMVLEEDLFTELSSAEVVAQGLGADRGGLSEGDLGSGRRVELSGSEAIGRNHR